MVPASITGMRAHWILGLCLLPVFGCSSPTGKSTFEEMKKSACAADVPGFFSHIDKTAIAESGKKRALAIADGKGIVGEMAKSLADGQINVAVQQTFTEWEDDVKKGSSGNLCKMQFVSSDERETTAEVKWKTASGKDKSWIFQRFDKKWLAIELTAPEEPVDEAKECRDLVSVFSAGQDSIAAAQKTAPDDSKDTAASLKWLGALADASAKASDAIDALTLRSPGLKQRASAASDTFQQLAKATRSVTPTSEAKDIEAASNDMVRLIKLEKEQFKQLSEHCRTLPPSSSPP
jgi:hypothetical protein